MVQGSENCLDNFQNNFQKMKQDTEKKMKESSTYSVADSTNKTESLLISNNYSVTLAPESTPRFTNNIKTIKEGLSVLDREFVAFREKTMASLHQKLQ